jgi:hypothetical protein
MFVPAHGLVAQTYRLLRNRRTQAHTAATPRAP